MRITYYLFSIVLSLLLGLSGWSTLQDPEDRKPVLPVDNLPAEVDLETTPGGLESLPEAPADNPTRADRVALGRKLFFDPVLSADGTVSCASCHQPDHGFASPTALSVGIGGQLTKRNAPSIINRGYGQHFFWDGRAATLEKQALGPLKSPAELGGDTDGIIASLKSNDEYVTAFNQAFDSVDGAAITIDNVCRAIACFERSVVSGDSRVDRFRASEYSALSKSARQGMWIFESRGGCWKCHSGPNFSDEEFHNTGVSFGTAERDTGRFQFTGDEEDRFKFKTPSLRDIELTPPYMHDGSIATLKEVVEFYNKGGAPDDPGLDAEMKSLNLSDDEVIFLVDFLKALTGKGNERAAESAAETPADE